MNSILGAEGVSHARLGESLEGGGCIGAIKRHSQTLKET